MRKVYLLTTISFLIFLTISQVAYASPNVFFNGKQLDFDVPPVIESDRTLVPLRAIFEAMGASVTWDATTQSVTAVKDATEIKLFIGGVAYNNGQLIILDIPAKLINNRTMVPLRFVSESFDCDVTWEDTTQTVKIKMLSSSAINNTPVYDSFRIENGDYYEGYAINGVPNGYGKLTIANGEAIVEGFFVNGQPPYEDVKITFPGEFVYEGDLASNGDFIGQGKLTTFDGFVYIGNFDNIKTVTG